MTQLSKSKAPAVDKPIFIGTLILLFAIVLAVFFFPDASSNVINTIHTFITTKLGFYYILFGIGSLGFCIWISASRYGRIKFGRPEDKPEFSRFSWIAMLFCGGVGAGLVYWGFLECLNYYSGPALGIEPLSPQAAEAAMAYGPFHWGPIAYAMFSVSTCAAGYLLHVRRVNIFKISEICRGWLGSKVDGITGRIIDIVFMFGVIAGSAAGLGLGTTLITAILSTIFHVTDGIALQIGVLVVTAAIFAFSTFLGLKKGMQMISNANLILAFAVLFFILIMGDIVFILNMGVTAMGWLLQNFVRMATWLDPVEVSGGFPESWTVFFWAWWAVFGPYMGMFLARISKGRTIRETLLSTIGFGSLGCSCFFLIFGGFSMSLQLSGKYDLLTSMNELGAPYAIVDAIRALPGSTVVLLVLAVIITLFQATSYDGCSHILASNSQTSLDENNNSKRWLRMLWAFCSALIPIAFLTLGSPLKPLQTASIVGALPVSFIIIIAAVSFVKMVRADERSGVLKYDSAHKNPVYNDKADAE